MRNWRKWAAGALALACCLSTASIPAFAEEEETAAEETAAAGDSTEAAAEEESSRTEAQEEIEITAEQVTAYMQKKNSCDGITFYYRPEDYEDTISDEDVVDLLDDIELAGIDDATGQVAALWH